ncbi:MAG TPA: ribonuclease III [Caulobacteraceae bacterium]|jgi:ribonuclease-3
MNARADAVAHLEAELGHAFKDKSLLEQALTHASVGQGARPVADYERLEFLGDRVLGLIVADLLLERFPEMSEGELAKRLNALVNRDACARVAERLGIGAALRLAPGETKLGGRQNKTILGDACEAVIAAVYRDACLDKARRVFTPLWEAELDQLGPIAALDPKSRLNEWALGRANVSPVYRVVGREGPDHAPRFTVEVEVEGVAPISGAGRSRQEAEKAAAAAMLDREGAA